MEKQEIIIYCDGGSRGNPGPAASAFVVTQDGNVIHKGSKFLGNETNNVAEYTAVLLAVEWLTKQFPISNFQFPIIINLDSQLVERQLNGKYKIKNEKLKVLYDQIKNLISKFEFPISFNWGYRASNTLADDLVNEELDRNSSR